MKKSVGEDVKFKTHSSCAASTLANSKSSGTSTYTSTICGQEQEITCDLFDFRTIVDILNNVAIFNHSLNIAL
jgi:hypothetical protein